MPEYSVFAASDPAVAAEPGRASKVEVSTNGPTNGHGGAPDPIELVLSAIAGGLLAGTARAARDLAFHLGAASVRVHGVSTAGAAPSLAVDYDLTIDSDEPDARVVQLHERIRRSESVLRLGDVCSHLSGRVYRRTLPNARR